MINQGPESQGNARANRLYRWYRILAVLVVVVAVSAVGWLFGRQLVVNYWRAVKPAAAPSAPTGEAVARLRGEVRSLALTPADAEVYLASADGVYHTPDEGAHWTALALPLEPGPGGVADVIVNPRSPAVVYVAGDGLGVLRSDDAGSSWRSVAAGLPNDRVRALAMHTYNSDTLYAYLAEDRRVYETRDAGVTWREPVDGPPAEAVALGHSTLSGSMNTGWLYAGAVEGLYLSMD